MSLKTKPNAPHPHTPLAAVFMVMIVALLTVGLLLIWRELPAESSKKPSTAVVDIKPVPAAPASSEQIACEAAKGKWVECGNPCHGKPGEVCIAKCEAQCLCGGIAGWMCPENQVCTDYVPSATTPDALGVCRERMTEMSKPRGPVRERPAGMICDELNFICVDEAVKDTTLTSPFVVKGSGLAFENTINWKLIDGNGETLEEGYVTAQPWKEYTPGDFTIRAFLLTVPKTASGTLEVFEYSAKDGTPINVVRIPVRLSTASQKTKLFLLSDPEKDCSAVTPIEIVIGKTNLPVEATLRSLLLEREPTTPKTYSALSQGVELRSISVKNGTASVVFSPDLEPKGGSCAVAGIRASIESTLKQFPSIKNVEISVIGKTPAETLQP